MQELIKVDETDYIDVSLNILLMMKVTMQVFMLRNLDDDRSIQIHSTNQVTYKVLQNL